MLTRESLAVAFNGKTFDEAVQLGHAYCLMGYSIDVRRSLAAYVEYRVWDGTYHTVLVEIDYNLEVMMFKPTTGAYATCISRS